MIDPVGTIFGLGVALRNTLYDRQIFKSHKLARPVVKTLVRRADDARGRRGLSRFSLSPTVLNGERRRYQVETEPG